MTAAVVERIEAEQALLGGLIIEPAAMAEVSRLVRPGDFYRPDHGRLFALIAKMEADGDHIDRVTVGDRVLRGGDDEQYGGYGYVLGLPDKVPSRVNLAHYAKTVRDASTMRRLARAGLTVSELAGSSLPADDAVSQAQAALQGVVDEDANRDWTPLGVPVQAEMAAIEARADDPEKRPGVTTGYFGLDRLLGGLAPKTLTVLAARPAMGKTALALNLAINAALLEECAVGFFSLEMGQGELAGRLLCAVSQVSATRVKHGGLDDDDWSRLDAGAVMLSESGVYIDDSAGVTIDDVRARARRLKAKRPDLGLVVVDYLQLMQGPDPRQNRQQQVSDISRGLKMLSKELDLPVLALSQLNRAIDTRADKRPALSDLRESGAIEQDADVVMFIYRDEVVNPASTKGGIAEVIVAKQRAGPTGSVELAFRKDFQRFDDLDRSHGPL